MTTALAGSIAFVSELARVLRVRPPHVSLAVAQPAQTVCGLYHAESRTIRLTELERAPGELIETLLHEFQHYLDDLYGRELGGALRGTHDPSFYRRLDALRELALRRLTRMPQ